MALFRKSRLFVWKNRNIKLVSLSKNFGAFNAVRAGSVICDKVI